MQLSFFVGAFFVVFGVPGTAEFEHVGQEVQLLSKEENGRKLTQNPSGTAELIYMQGIPFLDTVKIQAGTSTLKSGIPWGTPQCLGTFDSTSTIKYEKDNDPTDFMDITPSSPETVGNFILTTDHYTSTEHVQMQMIKVDFSVIQTYLDQGDTVFMFVNLVHGKSFDVVIGYSDNGLVQNIPNFQKVEDAHTVHIEPSKIAELVQGVPVKGFSMREHNSAQALATTPLGVDAFGTAGAFTLVFMVGDPGNLTHFPYKIIATDLSCKVVSSGEWSSGGMETSSTVARVFSVLSFIVCSRIWFL